VVDLIDEIWIAPALPEDATIRTLLLATGWAATDEQLARALAPTRGLPLRRRTRNRSSSGDWTSRTTNVVEVEDIRLDEVPRSTFEPPADYRRVRWEDVLARPRGASR
jgi:hypothetical protein